MSMLQVTPDPAGAVGRALIRVAGAAGAAGAPGFRVQRDADWTDATLGPNGWQSSDALLQPDRAEADGPDLLLHVGWPVCRFLEGGVYEVSVPGAGVAPTGVFWPDITPPAPVAAPAPPPTPQPVPVAESAPAPVEPSHSLPVTQPSPAPVPDVPVPGRRLLLPGVMALLLALAIGGTVAYRQFWPSGPVVVDPAPTPPPTPPVEPVVPTPPVEPVVPTPPVVPPPLDLGTLSVPEVLARAPNPAAITAEGERRLRGDRRDDGLVLLEEAADRGDAAAAAAIARLYDPVLFQPGGAIPRADARQAARRYRDAARGGADVAAAREALQRQLQERASRGDMGADLMLKDFWP